MAIRSITQLKKWFRRGMYPTESQFADWMESFWHKEEDRIPMSTVDGLPEAINAKYDATAGKEIEREQERLKADFAAHKIENENAFNGIYEDIEELEATDEAIKADLVGVHQDIAGLQSADTAIRVDIQALQQTDSEIRQDISNLQASDLQIIERIGVKATETLNASKAYTSEKIAEVVGGSPEALDTLYELSKALNDDPNFSVTVMNQIGNKADVGHTHTAGQVQEDATHRFVTDAEKTAWNEKVPSVHQHVITDVNGLQDALNGKYAKTEGVNILSNEINGKDGDSETLHLNYSGKSQLWLGKNGKPVLFGPSGTIAPNIFTDKIFVGGSQDVFYPVRIYINEEGVNRFVIRRYVHDDQDSRGSLRAEFISSYSGWSGYQNIIKCVYMQQAILKFIAGTTADYSSNMSGPIVYLRGNCSYDIDYCYPRKSTPDVYLQETNIGYGAYPLIVAPTNTITAEFDTLAIFPVVTTEVLPRTGGQVDGVLTIKPANASGTQNGLTLCDRGGGGWEGLKLVWTSPDYPNNSYIVGHNGGLFLNSNHKIYANNKEVVTQDQLTGMMKVIIAGHVTADGWIGNGCAGLSFTVSRNGSDYTVRHDLDRLNYHVILTGGNGGNGQIYAALINKTSSSFLVRTADDSTVNPGEFYFTMYEIV